MSPLIHAVNDKNVLKNTSAKISFLFLLAATVLFCSPTLTKAEILLEDTVWEGEVLLEDDIIVPEGVTLTVRKGAVINVLASDSTKTDPEYMSSMAEITIRGDLKVEGTADDPVIFRLKKLPDWIRL